MPQYAVQVKETGAYVEGDNRETCVYPTKAAAKRDMDDWCMAHMREHYEIVHYDDNANDKDDDMPEETILPLPQWQEKRKRRLIVTSATQYESWERCKRYWWFQKVRQLPQPMSTPQVFGTVLHDVVERYLCADDLGRDSNGNPVDLYPEGWHRAKNRFDPDHFDGEVSLGEQEQIKKLVQTAIDEGVIERRPHRAVEREFRETILEVDDCGTHVQIMGFIDLEFHGEVHDHKTTKNMRYAKSKNALKVNTQMLIYAKMHLLAAEQRGAAIPQSITLRHNVFCKDPGNPVVRKTEVTVSVAEIEAKWEQIVGYAAEMVQLRDNVENGLAEIPDPENPAASCNAYGGCPYMTICSGHESELGYEQRLDKAKSVVHNPSTSSNAPLVAQPRTKGSEMSSFAAKLAAKKGGAAAAAPSAPAMAAPVATAPVSTPAPEAAPVATETAPDAATGLVAPPWANPKCVACKGCGFNSKGDPCSICAGTAAKNGKPSPSEFFIQANGDGTVTWVNKTDDTICGVSPLQGYEAPAESQERVETPTEPEAPAEAPAAQKPTVADVKGTTVADTPAKTEKGGRPKKGFVLCINCGPLKRGNDRKGSGRHVLYLSEMLADTIGPMMAEAAGVESFYDISNFERRDQLRKHGEALCAEFGTDMVVAEGIGTGETDLKALCDGIRPYASVVLAPCVI